MSFNRCLKGTLIITLLVICANSVLHFLADNNHARGWPSNVVRNWQQFGLWTLHGKMVSNPGGFEVPTKPEVYKGHSPVSLYPVYLVKRLSFSTGDGNLLFHVLFSIMLMISSWSLLGRGVAGWLAGGAAVLSPAYTLYQATLDPNAISVLMTLPFAALILPILSRPTLSVPQVLLLFLLVLAYTSFNWTTALGHAMLAAYLLISRSISRQRLILYLVLAGVSCLLVVGVSIIGKLGVGSTRSGPVTMSDFLRAYTWGSIGYGAGLSTSRAVIRLTFVSIAGLLPLVGVWTWLLAKNLKAQRAGVWLSVAPICMGVAGALALRNYYGHHPWMVTPLIVVGLMLSCRSLVDRANAIEAPELALRLRPWASATFFAVCFLYAFLVSTMYRVHNHEFMAQIKLIREYTQRGDTIWIAESSDPKLAKEAATISLYTDRHVVVVSGSEAAKTSGNQFVLSATEQPQLRLVAVTSEPEMIGWPVVRQLLAFYARGVARRSQRDQHFRIGAPRYLYGGTIHTADTSTWRTVT